MPKKSKAQGRAAGIALAIKRGEMKGKPGSPPAEMAKSMSEEQLRDFAKGPEKGLPMRVKHTPTGSLHKKKL
jgi:hypothetical protein